MRFSDLAPGLGNARRLVLAGLERGWIWALAGLAALALILVLYRYERRLVSRRTGLALLGLRILAAAALVIALFEPIAERTFRERVRGRVIVGVDLSESMATADPGRPAAERERLRKALNLSPAEPVETLPRREIARRLLAGGWLKKAAAEHAIEAVGFAREAVAGTPETLAARLGRPAAADDAAGRTTDWRPVLEGAVKEQADGAPVLGVVLLTDGRDNAPGGEAPGLVERLKERGVPVHSVLIGSTSLPRDAAIAAVRAPETVDKGQGARIDVVVKADGLPPGTEVPVTLERPNASPLRKTVRAQADGGRPVVTFRVPFDAVGEHALAVAAGPVEGDVRTDNDRRTFKVVVVEDKARVLIVEGEARWEFQYLRNALMRDPRVKVEAVVLRQPPGPGSAGTVYPAAFPARPDDPKAADPLGSFDAILLGDVDPNELPADAWTRLDRYAAERGGTLVFGAGPRSWPGPMAAHDAARKLLPVVEPHILPVDPAAIDPSRPNLPAGVAIAPTPAAASGPWPMLQFADEVAPSQAVWQGLPRLPWVLAGKPKPTATVLVTAPGADDAAVMAAMPYGLGKVLWVGTDGTWRWRFRVGDAYHHRFWGQAVQWATRGKLAAGNRLVQFGPVPPRVPEGEPPTIRARFTDEAQGVGPDMLVAARIFRAGRDGHPTGDPVAVVPLRPKAEQPRVFEAAAPALPAASYVVRLDVPQLAAAMHAEGASADPEAALDVLARETSERVELAAARDPLDRLAAATGGRVLREAEADQLPALLRARTVERVRIEPTRIWDRPESLVLFFAVLTIEWVVRKRAGLP